MAASLEHGSVTVNGVRLHLVRAGQGRPLLLLHGWPEFWFAWEPVIQRLADRFSLVAPDLRGFGDSDKPDAGPSDKAGADVHAADMAALMEALGIRRYGIVCHDVGAVVAQAMARSIADRLAGLFFFDCPYPGIGARWVAPDHLQEVWYQYFHQMPMAAALLGSSREACRIYFADRLRHWAAGNPQAFDPLLEAWVDNFMKPGNLQGGFNWYISANAARLAVAKGTAPKLPPIGVPACARWGAADPVLPYGWTDRMGETFTDLDLAPFEGAGHFPHLEAPDRAAAEIARFFERVFPAE